MAKTLRVINPFFVMEVYDTFEYSSDSNTYVSCHNEDFYKIGDGNIDEISSSYNSTFQISIDYAKQLIKEGYLEEVSESEKRSSFVNIFDEIDNLLEKYKNGLKTIKEDTADLPACVKVERESVLTNLVTLLEHLKSLKK